MSDADGLYVNQYVPSEVTWGDVKLRQETGYPESAAWASGATVDGAKTAPGTWAVVVREWKAGDKLEIRMPLNMRMQPVDAWHPDRVAIVRGPLVLVQDANYHDPVMKLPMHDEDLTTWILPGDSASEFRVQTPEGKLSRLKLHPFYSIGPDFPYSTYFDRDKMPYALW